MSKKSLNKLTNIDILRFRIATEKRQRKESRKYQKRLENTLFKLLGEK